MWEALQAVVVPVRNIVSFGDSHVTLRKSGSKRKAGATSYLAERHTSLSSGLWLHFDRPFGLHLSPDLLFYVSELHSISVWLQGLSMNVVVADFLGPISEAHSFAVCAIHFLLYELVGFTLRCVGCNRILCGDNLVGGPEWLVHFPWKMVVSTFFPGQVGWSLFGELGARLIQRHAHDSGLCSIDIGREVIDSLLERFVIAGRGIQTARCVAFQLGIQCKLTQVPLGRSRFLASASRFPYLLFFLCIKSIVRSAFIISKSWVSLFRRTRCLALRTS